MQQSLGGLSSDLYPNNPRKTSCTYSPTTSKTLPQIVKDSNIQTEEAQSRVSKVITGNRLVVDTDELTALSSSATTTHHHKNKATFI